MNLEFRTMEKVVGAFILLTFLAFLGTVVLVGRGQNWFRQHVIYFAKYEEGYNLSPGAKVKLLRTNIGQVTSVDLTDDNKVRVTLRILEAYSSRIRADSKAVVESPTIIGSEYINIIPGSKDEPPIQPGDYIPSKEQKKIGDYLEEFDLEYKLQLFDEILENLSSLTDQLQQPKGPLMGTLSDVRQVTDSVAKGEGTLGRLIKSEEIHQKILDDLGEVNRILTSVHKAAESAAAMISQVEDRTPELTDRIQKILDRLYEVSGQLEKAMNEVPEISQDARRSMRDVNRILESVKQNFLIRPFLPKPPVPETHGLEIRGD